MTETERIAISRMATYAAACGFLIGVAEHIADRLAALESSDRWPADGELQRIADVLLDAAKKTQAAVESE